jgi:hypothetical protein
MRHLRHLELSPGLLIPSLSSLGLTRRGGPVLFGGGGGADNRNDHLEDNVGPIALHHLDDRVVVGVMMMMMMMGDCLLGYDLDLRRIRHACRRRRRAPQIVRRAPIPITF